MKKVCLYGDNPLANKSIQKLAEAEIEVCAVLDIRYNKKEYIDGILRIHPNDAEVKWMASECGVIICLGDASKHDAVAKNLYDFGFRRILYLSTDYDRSIEEKSMLRCLYAYFIAGEFEYVEIPEYKGKDSRINSPFPIISRREKRVSFWCPEEYLMTDTFEHACEGVRYRAKRGETGNLEVYTKYSDIPLSGFTVYTNLYLYLDGDTERTIDDYLQYNRSNVKDREAFLENRRALLKIFEWSYKYDMSFFTEGPAMAVYDKGGFRILDGYHRIFFLRHKGLREYPITVSADDFDDFIRSRQKGS